MTKEKKPARPMDRVRVLRIVYISIIAVCVGVLAFMITFLCFKYQKNIQLKKQADSIVEKYNKAATEHNNLSDPDYAEIYFDNNVIYIPNEDVVIEFEP